MSVFFEERMAAMHGFSNELVDSGNTPSTVFQRVKQVGALVNGWQAYMNTLPMDITKEKSLAAQVATLTTRVTALTNKM